MKMSVKMTITSTTKLKLRRMKEMKEDKEKEFLRTTLSVVTSILVAIIATLIVLYIRCH